jgi:hypothetical protein
LTPKKVPARLGVIRARVLALLGLAAAHVAATAAFLRRLLLRPANRLPEA